MTNQEFFCPECYHDLIINLQDINDFTLWDNWQKRPDMARYLIAIFCRYYSTIYTVDIASNSPNIIYQYSQNIWFFIFDNLRNYPLNNQPLLKNTILNLTSQFLTEETLIYDPYFSQENLPQLLSFIPLKYFIFKALENLTPLERLIILTQDKFAWQEEQIIQYLNYNQNPIIPSELKGIYTQAYSHLINILPTDIITIYF